MDNFYGIIFNILLLTTIISSIIGLFFVVIAIITHFYIVLVSVSKPKNEFGISDPSYAMQDETTEKDPIYSSISYINPNQNLHPAIIIILALFGIRFVISYFFLKLIMDNLRKK